MTWLISHFLTCQSRSNIQQIFSGRDGNTNKETFVNNDISLNSMSKRSGSRRKAHSNIHIYENTFLLPPFETKIMQRNPFFVFDDNCRFQRTEFIRLGRGFSLCAIILHFNFTPLIYLVDHVDIIIIVVVVLLWCREKIADYPLLVLLVADVMWGARNRSQNHHHKTRVALARAATRSNPTIRYIQSNPPLNGQTVIPWHEKDHDRHHHITSHPIIPPPSSCTHFTFSDAVAVHIIVAVNWIVYGVVWCDLSLLWWRRQFNSSFYSDSE